MARLALISMGAAVMVAALGGPAAWAAEVASPVVDTSFVNADGTRTLQKTIVVQASRAAVWQAFTDADSYRQWAAPVAFIDLRLGGTIEVSYDPEDKAGDPNNVKAEILSYLPGEMISFRNVQAVVVPHAEIYHQLAIVLTLKDVGGGRTEVSLADVGFGTAPGTDELYGFFDAHNPEYLEEMKAFVEKR